MNSTQEDEAKAKRKNQKLLLSFDKSKVFLAKEKKRTNIVKKRREENERLDTAQYSQRHLIPYDIKRCD